MSDTVKQRSFRVDPAMKAAESKCFAFGEVAFFSAPSPDHPESNEDSAVVIARNTWGVLAVSDGAGGTAGGALAASMAVEILQQAACKKTEVQDVRAAILDAIESADTSIREKLPGALATMATFILDGRAARAISVGDSICAVIGGRGKIKYRSIAHGPTGFAEEAGMLEQGEALTHDERHLVSNMLGLAGMRVEVGIPLKLAPRDTVLVASDALFDNVQFDEIAKLAKLRPLVRAVDALVALAVDRMTGDGPLSHADDLTILACRPPKAPVAT